MMPLFVDPLADTFDSYVMIYRLDIQTSGFRRHGYLGPYLHGF